MNLISCVPQLVLAQVSVTKNVSLKIIESTTIQKNATKKIAVNII